MSLSCWIILLGSVECPSEKEISLVICKRKSYSKCDFLSLNFISNWIKHFFWDKNTLFMASTFFYCLFPFTVLSFCFLRTMVYGNWKRFLLFSLGQWESHLLGCLAKQSPVAQNFFLVRKCFPFRWNIFLPVICFIFIRFWIIMLLCTNTVKWICLHRYFDSKIELQNNTAGCWSRGLHYYASQCILALSSCTI